MRKGEVKIIPKWVSWHVQRIYTWTYLWRITNTAKLFLPYQTSEFVTSSNLILKANKIRRIFLRFSFIEHLIIGRPPFLFWNLNSLTNWVSNELHLKKLENYKQIQLYFDTSRFNDLIQRVLRVASQIIINKWTLI